MKAILEFDLNDTDERMDHERALRSTDLALVISKLYEDARKLYKYSDNEEDIRRGEWFREMVSAAVEEYEIDLDRLLY